MAMIEHAHMMAARGLRGYWVENEEARCGVLRVYAGVTPQGLQRVFEYDCRKFVKEPAVTSPGVVLSGIPFATRLAPGWKIGRTGGGIEWY